MKPRQYAPRLIMVLLIAAFATAAVDEDGAPGTTAAPIGLRMPAAGSAPAPLPGVTGEPAPGVSELTPGPSEPLPVHTVSGAAAAAGAAVPVQYAVGDDASPLISVTPDVLPPPTAPPSPPGPPAAPRTAPGVVTGTVERLWADQVLNAGRRAGDPVEQIWLAAPQQYYRLAAGALTAGVLAGVSPGSQVTVDLGAGDEVSGHPVVAVADVVAPAPAEIDGVRMGPDTLLDFAALPAAVTHEVTVVLAVPAGASADATTVDGLRDRVAGPVAGYWSAQSRGQRSIVVAAAHSWVQLSSSCTGSPFNLWNEVAGKVGFSSGPRKHLLVYLPTAAGCGAGLGTVGPAAESGGLMWVSHNSTDVIAHEFGHNLGLGHSNGLLCPSSSDGVHSGGWTGGCTAHGYRDYYDVMGVSWGNVGSLSTVHADTLGFLSSSDKLTVTAPTRVRLAAVSGNGLRTAKINDPGGTYYVEYRPAQAGDAWLTGNWRGLDPGVLVRRVSPGDARESLLLDGSVSGGSRTDDWQAALAVGRTLTTASGRNSVTVESADGSGATVTVTVDGQSPPPPVGAPVDGAQVTFAAPANGASVPAGVTTFSGVATAPGGTLLWQVSQGSTVRASGSASTGGEGVFDSFSFPVSLPAGTYTVRAYVPDESDGEGSSMGGARFSQTLTVTVS